MPPLRKTKARREPEQWNKKNNSSRGQAIEVAGGGASAVASSLGLGSRAFDIAAGGSKMSSASLPQLNTGKGKKKYPPGPDASTAVLEEHFSISIMSTAPENLSIPSDVPRVERCKLCSRIHDVVYLICILSAADVLCKQSVFVSLSRTSY